MTYSDQYKFIYIAVPKTGSRSIQDYLQSYGIRSPTGWSPNHDNYEQTRKKLGNKKCDEYFKFSFFRNPWARAVSLFFYNKHVGGLLPNKQNFAQWLRFSFGEDYISYIYDESGKIILDFIGKLEHLDKDFKIICEKINLPVPEKLPHIGKQSYGGRLHYTEYYTPELIERVRNLYAKSLDILNYEFGDA